MFTQPCFIYSLIDVDNALSRLIEFGYKKDIYKKQLSKFDNLAVYNGKYGFIDISFEETHKEFINCYCNLQIFLALAALRDDTDKYQWFVYNNDNNIWDYCFNDKFIYSHLLFYPEIYKWLENELSPVNWHKATPQEIIEHFK